MAKAKVKQQQDESQVRSAMKAASNASKALANTQVDLLKFTDDGKLDASEKARLRAGNKQVFQHLGAFDALIADGADAARLQRQAEIAQEINDTLSVNQATLLVKLARGMSRKDLTYETDPITPISTINTQVTHLSEVLRGIIGGAFSDADFYPCARAAGLIAEEELLDRLTNR